MLKAAVIGAGNMGRHHIRILGRMSDVQFVGVVDLDVKRASHHAALVGGAVFTHLDELPDVDFAIVATPTQEHLHTALALIDRGVSLMVEKPLAENPEDARRIAEAADDAGVVLAVGHVERFNAAVSVLAGLAHDPVMLSFERLSPYTPRIKDSVVFDLMVHDLDLACWIAGAYPTRIEAMGTRVFSDSLDVASALLEFPSGCIASLQASRMTQDKVRRISVSERKRFLVADSIRQDVSIKRETAVEFDDEAGGMYRQANVVEVPYLDRSGEPLERELRDVLDAIRCGRPPLVDGEAGVRAVELAHAVEQAARAR
ncbi:MAG: Gfo/Idh/MocA family oxidoreductase [Coriobacteriia bacterium]|jgi:predicted dehydrogenase|nr:Gfo/Idh/MocA family oxidoreductase [Coriobacteriia bacterium]